MKWVMLKHRRAVPPKAIWTLFAALPLLLLWPRLRYGIESRMSLHMLLEFPLLFAAGWAVQRLAPSDTWLRWLDWRGWTGATLTSLVVAGWMLPSLLDMSLMVPLLAAAKYTSWWLAGWWLASSWRRLDPEVLLFLVGNIAWMNATAGMLYLETPQRLCVNYLQDDQKHTGIGLVMLAIGLGALAIRQAMKEGTSDRDCALLLPQPPPSAQAPCVSLTTESAATLQIPRTEPMALAKRPQTSQT